jgi:trans-2-enoyl-CoA reductase
MMHGQHVIFPPEYQGHLLTNLYVLCVLFYGDRRETVDLGDKVGDSQVLIRMLAAPINPADLNMVQGTYGVKPSNFPVIAGNEGVAVVEKVGAKVSGLAVGDWVVAAKPAMGTWTERNLVSADALDPVSKDIPVEYAATLAVNPATAYRLLADFAQLKKGDVIIQNAANSTVGLAVVQLAKARGISTINIVRNRPDYEAVSAALKGLGADVVVHEDLVKAKGLRDLVSDVAAPKLALNATGGETVTEMARVLADGGQLVTYGGMSRKPVTLPTSALIFRDVQLRGFWLTKWVQTHSAQERRAMHAELAAMVKKGELKLALERAKFADFEAALEKAQAPFRGRKVVLTFDSK